MSMLMSQRKLTHGFSLIECLVALLVLSVGLLGVSKMLENSVHYSGTALVRSQAANLAYDLADKIRANKDEAQAYAVGLEDQFDSAPDCMLAPCSGAQMAQSDLSEWKTTLDRLLPEGEGMTAIGPSDATISVQWSYLGQQRSYSLVVAL